MLKTFLKTVFVRFECFFLISKGIDMLRLTCIVCTFSQFNIQRLLVTSQAHCSNFNQSSLITYIVQMMSSQAKDPTHKMQRDAKDQIITTYNLLCRYTPHQNQLDASE